MNSQDLIEAMTGPRSGYIGGVTPAGEHVVAAVHDVIATDHKDIGARHHRWRWAWAVPQTVMWTAEHDDTPEEQQLRGVVETWIKDHAGVRDLRHKSFPTGWLDWRVKFAGMGPMGEPEPVDADTVAEPPRRNWRWRQRRETSEAEGDGGRVFALQGVTANTLRDLRADVEALDGLRVYASSPAGISSAIGGSYFEVEVGSAEDYKLLRCEDARGMWLGTLSVVGKPEDLVHLTPVVERWRRRQTKGKLAESTPAAIKAFHAAVNDKTGRIKSAAKHFLQVTPDVAVTPANLERVSDAAAVVNRLVDEWESGALTTAETVVELRMVAAGISKP